jgi:hypothetical protein
MLVTKVRIPPAYAKVDPPNGVSDHDNEQPPSNDVQGREPRLAKRQDVWEDSLARAGPDNQNEHHCRCGKSGPSKEASLRHRSWALIRSDVRRTLR